MEVEDLIEEADQLFEQAEFMIVKEPARGLLAFQTGVGSLLKAFLAAHGKEPKEDLKALFQLCKEIDPEFASIEDELEFVFNSHLAETDSELISDAANEIWDFVIGQMPE